jgi:hypothetical protein
VDGWTELAQRIHFVNTVVNLCINKNRGFLNEMSNKFARKTLISCNAMNVANIGLKMFSTGQVVYRYQGVRRAAWPPVSQVV